MYLSNSERERLGLIAYGSDVPDDVVAEAEARLAASEGCPLPAATPQAPKRARSRKGKFLADDPATAEVNEAYVDG